MRKKDNTLALMTAMNQQQSQQFMAATLLAIAITMKKAGLTELIITPNDFALLEQGETLEPIPTVEGGMIYRFHKVAAPLAKRVVPDVMKAVKPAKPTVSATGQKVAAIKKKPLNGKSVIK